MSQPAAVASASFARSSPRCQAWTSLPRLPSGFSRLCSGPAAKPSSEIDIWQVVSGIAGPSNDCDLQAPAPYRAEDCADRSHTVTRVTGMGDWPRVVAIVDMDAFYASVERRRQPQLKGKPVVVCGSGPRAVVTTASNEARKLAGIQSAMPAAVARRRLPDAIYLRPDFDAYRAVSREVMEILRANAETVEVV